MYPKIVIFCCKENIFVCDECCKTIWDFWVKELYFHETKYLVLKFPWKIHSYLKSSEPSEKLPDTGRYLLCPSTLLKLDRDISMNI